MNGIAIVAKDDISLGTAVTRLSDPGSMSFTATRSLRPAMRAAGIESGVSFASRVDVVAVHPAVTCDQGGVTHDYATLRVVR